MQKKRKKRGWPQPLPRDAQMMHVQNLTRPKNPYRTPATSVCTALSLWKLPKPRSRLLTHCRAPPARQNSHRHSRISIGCWIDNRHFKYCWPTLNSAGRQKLPAEDSFDSKQRTDSAWHGVFRHMWAWACFLSCFELKEVWPSILEPSMVHDSPRDRICHLM